MKERKPPKVLLITNMYPTLKKPYFGTFVKDQVESLRHEGAEVDVLFVDGVKNSLNYIWAFPRLWLRLLTRRYDLIHAHYVFSGIIARAQLLYPVILTHHGSQVFDGWQAPVCRFISKYVDKTIVMSPEMRDRGRLGKATIIPCGINMGIFKPGPLKESREKLGLPREKKLVAFIGEHDRPLKRWDIAQESVRLLQQKLPDAELVCVSKKPFDVIPDYMNASDVLVLVSDSEGSPMVIKEAMACNMPIVAVPVGDVPDVIKGTEGCFLCTNDPVDVAEKLEIALCRGTRTAGREKMKPLSLEAISRRILQLYEEILMRKTSKSGKR